MNNNTKDVENTRGTHNKRVEKSPFFQKTLRAIWNKKRNFRSI